MSAVRTPDPEHALRPTGNLVRRVWISRVFEVLARLAAVVAVAVLLLVVVFITIKGVGAWFSPDFFGGPLYQQSASPGGLGPAFVGTIELVAMTVVMAAPLSILIAIYTVEFAPRRVASAIRALTDIMNGIPTIVVGVFVSILLVEDGLLTGQAGWKASLALAIVVTPLITRSSIEALGRVPPALREAADALGVARWRSLFGVVLPTAAPAIVTAVILSSARAAGETAPVLFTDFVFGQGYRLNPTGPIANVPIEIFTLILNPSATAQQRLWGAALVLLAIILGANIISRVLLARAERKRGL